MVVGRCLLISLVSSKWYISRLDLKVYCLLSFQEVISFITIAVCFLISFIKDTIVTFLEECSDYICVEAETAFSVFANYISKILLALFISSYSCTGFLSRGYTAALERWLSQVSFWQQHFKQCFSSSGYKDWIPSHFCTHLTNQYAYGNKQADDLC